MSQSVLVAEAVAQDGGGRLPNLAATLRAFPGRWSPPTLGAASAWPRDEAPQTWPQLLDRLELAIGDVVPDEMTADRRTGLHSTVVPAAPKAAV